MPFSSSQIELLGTVGGIAGFAISALKFFIPYTIDQTLSRKAAKTSHEIEALLERLAKLERPKSSDASLEPRIIQT